MKAELEQPAPAREAAAWMTGQEDGAVRWEQHPVANSFITNVFSDHGVTEWTRLWTQVFGLVNAGRCG